MLRDPFEFLLSFLALGISLVIAVPLSGVLVRFRANYSPKAPQLDAEDGTVPQAGPVVKSYFSMLARVYRLEGFSGLYKGLMPTAISTFLITAVILLFVEIPKPHFVTYRPFEGSFSILGALAYAIGTMIVTLPIAIITYRSITTPYKLGWFKPVKSLRILLTPTERRKPWVLYLTPGLVLSQILHIGIVLILLGPLHRVLLPAAINSGLNSNDVSLRKAAIWLLLATIYAIVLTPLEVITIRLAIQRNHGSSEYTPLVQEVEGAAAERSGTEDVIGLRDEGDPYTGLVDCTKRMLNEEGTMALYRAWWLTWLGGMGSVMV